MVNYGPRDGVRLLAFVRGIENVGIRWQRSFSGSSVPLTLVILLDVGGARVLLAGTGVRYTGQFKHVAMQLVFSTASLFHYFLHIFFSILFCPEFIASKLNCFLFIEIRFFFILS